MRILPGRPARSLDFPDAVDLEEEMEDAAFVSMSAVVVNYNGGSDLIRCLESLERQPGLHEIIVVDNDSQDGSLELARQGHPSVRFIARGSNDGYGTAANEGALDATADALLFLNPDVVLDDGCVEALTAALVERPGVVGPLLRLDESDREFGATVDILGMPRGLQEPGSPLYVHGCALATTTSVFTRVGGFDPRYFLFMEDAELCWRALIAGYEVSICAAGTGWHRGGGSIPGGYIRGDVVTTTETRVVLRERNGLTMFLACAPTGWLPALVALHVLKTLGVAAAAAVLLRRPRNVRNVPASLERRRAVDRDRGARRRAFRRIARRSNALTVLRRYGLPRFVETPPQLEER
jgi:N-acetylglucosaminyl-diphospho-decaprenol L-rhamnosyltransferase